MENRYTNFSRIVPQKMAEILISADRAGNFLCGEGYVAKRKKYDRMLMIRTISGKGGLKYRNRNYELEKGSLMLIDCNEPQVYFTAKGSVWEFDYIHFSGANSRQMVGFILENSGPVLKGQEDESIAKSFQSVMTLMPEVGLKNDILISRHLGNLLNRLMILGLPQTAEKEELPELVKAAVRVIESGYADRLQLDKMACTLYVDKYHLLRKFKKYLGVTPREYLARYRIKQAKTLLEASSMNINEIAAAVGMENLAYFIKVFKKIEKMTPAMYRKYLC